METIKDGQPVDVQLQSSIQHEGQEAEKQELTAAGVLIQKAGKTYLQFEEGGHAEPVKTIVKLDKDDAFIMRKGAVQMRLPFTNGDMRPGTYGNGPVAFNLLVKTTKLEVTNRQFTVHYELHADGAKLGTHELLITYTEGNV